MSERLRELVGRGGEESRLGEVGLAEPTLAPGPDRSVGPAADRHPGAEDIDVVAGPRPSPGPVDAHPAGRLVPGGTPEHADDGRQLGRHVTAGVGGDALARVIDTDRHPDAGRPGLVTQDRHDVRQHLQRRGARGERPAQAEKGSGLPLASVRLIGSRPEEGDELAHDDPDEEEQGEVEPDGRVVDREAADGMGEEEVVEEERPGRGEDRAERPRKERVGDDDHDEQRRCVGEPDVGLEERDQERRRRQRRGRHEERSDEDSEPDSRHAHDGRRRRAVRDAGGSAPWLRVVAQAGGELVGCGRWIELAPCEGRDRRLGPGAPRTVPQGAVHPNPEDRLHERPGAGESRRCHVPVRDTLLSPTVDGRQQLGDPFAASSPTRGG